MNTESQAHSAIMKSVGLNFIEVGDFHFKKLNLLLFIRFNKVTEPPGETKNRIGTASDSDQIDSSFPWLQSEAMK